MRHPRITCIWYTFGIALFSAIGTSMNYYYVFVGCSLFFLIVAYFYFPETRHKTLEEIAAAFGDKVVEVSERDAALEKEVLAEKAGAAHIEVAKTDTV